MLKKFSIKNDDGSSKDIAKERLQLILVQDRIKISPEKLELLKIELINVLSKYINVDSNNIRMEIDRQDEMMALVANFPLKRKL